MIQAEQVIARLIGSEQYVDLIDHRGKISVFLGSAAFTLLYSGELQDLGEPCISFSERLAGYKRNISLKTAMLEPGQSIKIGRSKGIEILDPSGAIDGEAMHRFRDEGLYDSLLHDEYLSRRHAEIAVIDFTSVLIRDLGSTNGTTVKGVIPDGPEIGRPHLRVVKGGKSP